MSEHHIGRLSVRWQRSTRSWLNVLRAFRGPEPRAELHLHLWEYVTVIPDRDDDIESWPRRVCRNCGGREDLR